MTVNGFIRKEPMTTLTKSDMYDKDGKCTLPKITLKKYINRSKYSPRKDTPKEYRKAQVSR